MNKKENYLRAIKRQYPEWIPYHSEAIKTIGIPLAERPRQAGKDCFGCEWDYNPLASGGTFPAEHDFVITDIMRWKEQLVIPSVVDAHWEQTAEKALQIDRFEYIVQGFCEMGLFERSYLLMGMENALVAYYSNPDEMYALCGAIADYKIRVLQELYRVARPDMIWYGDDWGTQRNLFISPEIWRQIIKPHTLRIYDCIKGLGMLINQHSCGRIETVLGDICEMGADMWNPCQPCNDLAMLKRQYGEKISFCGGIDGQFVLDNESAGVEEVRNEVVRRIGEMSSPQGGYIAGPSHSVPYNPNKLQAMMETLRQYGKLNQLRISFNG